MEKLKCKIVDVNHEYQNYSYIVIDKNYKIVANGVSSSESWVRNDAGGYHTDEEFNELYGEGKWEVDFSDMYSDESEKITGKLEPNITITTTNN